MVVRFWLDFDSANNIAGPHISFSQVQDDWQLGIHYSVNDMNHFELNELVIIQRSDGRKTFAAICNIDSTCNEYECKVCSFIKARRIFLVVTTRPILWA